MGAQETPPGWHEDPSGRFEYRWWDGENWTDQAARGGQVVHDPMSSAPAVTELGEKHGSVAGESQPDEGRRPSNGGGAAGNPAQDVHPDTKITAFNAKKIATRLQDENRHLKQSLAALETVTARFGGLEAAEVVQETNALRQERAELVQQLRGARTELARVSQQLVVNRERVDLETDFGIYDYEHPAEASATLGTELESVRSHIKSMAKAGRATDATNSLSYGGSEAKGRTFVNQMSRVMLRWYNAEAESAVKSVKAGNLASAQKRLARVKEQVSKQGRMIDLTITSEYHRLRLRELGLAARHLQAVAAEKERDREHRAQLREQRIVEAELAKERQRLGKERKHYENSIQRLREGGDEAGAIELEGKLATIDEEIAAADYRATNIRAGYVYVISNMGAFGPDVVKIGMTRRLEPMDRVRELGDASVPFRFDVHALFFSDDAVSIETMLHHAFAEQRINKVNLRREFFRISPDQVLDALREHDVSVLEFRLEAAAEEYRASSTAEFTDQNQSVPDSARIPL